MNFQEAQRHFAAHIRNPDLNSAPSGIEDRRMSIYRELFYNNVESFISNGFPVLRSITTGVEGTTGSQLAETTVSLWISWRLVAVVWG